MVMIVIMKVEYFFFRFMEVKFVLMINFDLVVLVINFNVRYELIGSEYLIRRK